MSRYPPNHKAKTRAHLVETARRLFRENGFDGISIDKLMKAAGLTRGGFYAHFASKEALVSEVLRIEAGLIAELDAAIASEAPRSGVGEALSRYLDPAHRDALIQCPLVAHPIDAKRGASKRSALYTHQIGALAERLGKVTSEDDALLLTVLSVGAAILGTATDGDDLSDRIHAVAIKAIQDSLTTS
ncbi:MAG: TetR/AcrR family transcriptional regulator [Myxococcota bacterium]